MIYNGWTYTQPRPRTIADDERQVRDMVTLIKATVASGRYKMSPHLLDLDLAELLRRDEVLQARKAAQL